MMKKIGCACGILVLLVIIAGGVMMWRLSIPPQRLASSVPATSEQRAQQETVVRQLHDQMAAIHDQAQQKQHAPFTLHITETQLNGILAKGVEKGGKYNVQNLAAQLQPGILTLQGTANYHGAPVTLTLTGNVELKNSQIQFNAKSLWLGPFQAPSKWKNEVSEFVSKQLNKAVSKDASRLDTIEIKSGELIITGVTR